MALRARLKNFASTLHRQYRRPVDTEPPHEPGPVPWLGVGVDYGRDAGSFLTSLRDQHGTVFSVFLAGHRVTFVTDPRDFGTVLSTRTLDFHGLAAEISATAFGHTLEAVDVVTEHGISKLSIDHMRGAALTDLTERFQDAFHRLVLQGETPDSPDLYSFVADIIFPTAGEAVFGEGFAASVQRDEFDTLDQAFPRLVAGAPAEWFRGVAGARTSLRQTMGMGFGDASQLTVDRMRMMRGTISEEDRGALQLSFLWAAQANTLPAVFWTLFHILRDAEAHEAVGREVRDALAEAPVVEGKSRFDKATLRRLVLLDCAIDEALRLTSGSLTLREALEDTTLVLHDGRKTSIRKGDRVAIFPYLMHHDPVLYPDPEEFQLRRYLAEDGTRRTDFTWKGTRIRTWLMPFGGGVSMCPGRHFARNEIKVATALLLAHFDLALTDRAIPPLDTQRAGLGILPPTTAVPFTVTRAASTPEPAS